MFAGKLGGHAEYLAQQAEELAPLVERSFAVLRRPLGARLKKHRAFLAASVRSEPAFTLSIYGIEPGEGVESTADEARDRWIARVDALASDLAAGRRGCIQEMLHAIVAAMARSIEVCASGEASSDDSAVIIDGDTAFRLNRYLIEMIERCLADAKPKNMIGVRSF